jgi:hypothetical protein
MEMYDGRDERECSGGGWEGASHARASSAPLASRYGPACRWVRPRRPAVDKPQAAERGHQTTRAAGRETHEGREVGVGGGSRTRWEGGGERDRQGSQGSQRASRALARSLARPASASTNRPRDTRAPTTSSSSSLGARLSIVSTEAHRRLVKCSLPATLAPTPACVALLITTNRAGGIVVVWHPS